MRCWLVKGATRIFSFSDSHDSGRYRRNNVLDKNVVLLRGDPFPISLAIKKRYLVEAMRA